MKNEYLTEKIDIIDSPKEIKQILKQNGVEILLISLKMIRII